MVDPVIVETIRIDVDDAQASRAYDGLEQSQRDLAKAVRSLEGALNDTMGDVAKGAKTAERKVAGLNSRLLNLDAALGLAQKSAQALRRAFDALQRPVDLATGFEAGVAQIRTLGQDLAADFDEQLLALARDLPQTAGDLTRATYDAISAGIQPTEVIQFIRDTSDAAVAGEASLTDSVRALTTSVNSFRELSGDASKAADILFGTVRAGVTNFQELAATDLAASLGVQGVQLREIGALLAELTSRGLSSSQALTAIEAATKAIAKPTGKAQKLFKRLGVDVGVAAIQSKGLTGILEELREATAGNVDVINQLSDRNEATALFLPILTDGFKDYQQTLQAIDGAQGATAESAAIMANTARGAQARFRSLTEGVLTQLGREVLPVVNELLADIGAWLDANGDELVAAIKGAVEGLVDLGRWAATNGRELVSVLTGVFVAKKVTEWTAAVGKAMEAVADLGGAAAGAGESIAGRLFQPKSLGGAFAAALKSPAFIGLVAGALTGLGVFIADKVRAEFAKRIAGAEASGAARVDAPTRELAPLDRESLQQVSEENLRRIFGERGAEGLAEFVEAQRKVLGGRIKAASDEFQQLGVQVRRRSKAFRSTLQGLAERVEGVTADMSAEDILGLPESVKREILTRTGSNLLFGDSDGGFLEDAAELVRLQKEAGDPGGAFSELSKALRELPQTVAKVTAPMPIAPGVPPPDTSKADKDRAERRRALEDEARLALALANAYSDAQRKLIKFDAKTKGVVADARAAGADIALVEESRRRERQNIVADILRSEVQAFESFMSALNKAAAESNAEMAEASRERMAMLLREQSDIQRAARESARDAFGEAAREGAGDVTAVGMGRLARARAGVDTEDREAADAAIARIESERQRLEDFGAAVSGLSDVGAEIFAGVEAQDALDAAADRQAAHYEHLISMAEEFGHDTSALREESAASAEMMAERMATAQVVGIVRPAQAAIGSLQALASAAGASLGFIGILEKLQLIATGVQEAVLAKRDFAMAASAFAFPAFGGPSVGAALIASGAAHAAAAALAGAQIAGLGGGGGGASIPSVPAASSRPAPAALPPPQQTQSTVYQVTINGLIATDQRAANMLGQQTARSVAAQIGRDAGRRGALPLPASAGRRF